MTAGPPRTVFAAGAVLWRDAGTQLGPGTAGPDGAGPEVALVHRPRYDDWSLPKGKADAGEHLLVTARREVQEETGIVAVAGRSLGRQEYTVNADGRPARKVVRYWAMQAISGRFTPNHEVDELVWLPVPAALQRLSYERDAIHVRRLVALPYRTSMLLLARHGHAGSKRDWPGEDRLRPLDEVGREEAAALCRVAPVFAPQHVHSADLTRCVDTVRPLADLLVLPVELEPALTGAAHAQAPQRTTDRVRAIVAKGRATVLCSQGEVIPDLVTALASGRRRAKRPPPSRKGSVWALSFAGSRLVGAQYFPSLRPACG